MPRSIYRNQVVRIADLVVNKDVVADAEFNNCQIIGPAVVVFINSQVVSCVFLGQIEAVLWPVPPEREAVSGAVAFEGCVFIGCHFDRIGIAGPPAVIQMFRDNWAETEAQDQS